MYYREYSVSKFAKGGITTDVFQMLKKVSEKDFDNGMSFEDGNKLISIQKKTNPISYNVRYLEKNDKNKFEIVSSYSSPNYEDVINEINTFKYAKGGEMKEFEKTRHQKLKEFRIALFELEDEYHDYIYDLDDIMNGIDMIDVSLTKRIGNYAKGGVTNDEGVDLFEDYGKNIPKNVLKILNKYDYAFMEGDYEGLTKAHDELYKIGYTFESGFDGQAYDLRKIGQRGKISGKMANGGMMAKGGMVVTSIKDIPNFKEELEAGNITYRGLGLGKIYKDFYNLAGTNGFQIKVKNKQYFITDKEFDTFSRDKLTGKMVIKFDAPYRKG